MKIRYFMLAALLPLLFACTNKVDPILYRIAQMGFVQKDGSFLGDDGRTYVFSNVGTDVEWDNVERLMAVFDVTASIDGEDKYSANLLDYQAPLYKKPFAGNSQELIDSLGTAPLKVNDIWFSGGCLNMLNTLTFNNADSKHSVDLLIKAYPPASDTLKMVLMHNAGGDQVDEYAEEMIENSYSFYSSFPLKDYLPTEGELVLSLEWRWKGETQTIDSKVKF